MTDTDYDDDDNSYPGIHVGWGGLTLNEDSTIDCNDCGQTNVDVDHDCSGDNENGN